MPRPRIEARLGPVVDLGRARCPDRLHQFSKLGNDGTGKGNVERLAGGLVWGVVYELEVVQLDQLVEIESGYRMIELELELEFGSAISFEAEQPATGLSPTCEYLEHYVAGIREHAIPEDYLGAVLGEFAALVRR